MKKHVVIKVTNKALHFNKIVIKNGVKIGVEENILLEKSILKYLTKDKKCPNSIVKYHSSFQSNINFYLVMQDGGTSLFEFVFNAHKFIQAKKLSVKQWLKMCKLLFKQMIECIQYIHNKNVAHFDISLENFLINNVDVEILPFDQISFCFDSKIQCKLCDFGLSHYFKDSNFSSSKYCGLLC